MAGRVGLRFTSRRDGDLGIDAPGELAEGDQDGARDVRLGVLGGLSNVEQKRAAGKTKRQLVGVDLGDG